MNKINMKSLLYTKLANYYDLFLEKDYKRESEFIVEVLQDTKLEKIKLVDLGCGTAKHIQLIAKHGIHTHGLDISPNMLSLAEKNSQSSSFSQQDMKNFSLSEDYNVAMCLGTSFNYLLEDHDFVSFSRSLKKNHIKYVILDSSNFSFFRRQGKVQKVNKIFKLKNQVIEMEKIIIFEKSIRKLLLHYKFTDTANNVSKQVDDIALARMYSLKEIKTLMGNEYELIDSYGDYDKKERYSTISQRMILVFKLIE